MEQNTKFRMEQCGASIKASGIFDAQAAEEAGRLMCCNQKNYTIDFNLVTDIDLAAVRSLIAIRKSGSKFCIINAADSIMEKFEDSGAAFYINICRKPRKLNLEEFEEFGASYMSKAYNSLNGNSMIKVYNKRIPIERVAKEQMAARAVMQFGITTPLVGRLLENNDYTALEFERINNKRSFSRIISQEPERMVEIMTRFASMCKELHSKPCDTSIFDNRRLIYRSCIEEASCITPEEKKKVLAFIETIPEATTCLHGDMQISNVITTGKEDLWIDLADFGYGYFMLDMGMWYFLSNLTSAENCMSLFHLSKTQARSCWEIFVREYFNARSHQEIADVERAVEKYAALHMLFLGSNFGFEPGMTDYIEKKLLL